MSESLPIRVGVIGVGRMGQLHAQKYSTLPGVHFVGVFDLQSDRAREVADRYSVKAYKSVAELLFDADAVTIATPTPTHFLVAKAAIEAGVHVLVEKPLAETVEQARDLVPLAERHGVVLQVGLIERFRYRGLTGNASFGGVQYIETQRLTPNLARDATADVVTDLMIHDLDLVLSLIPEDPVSVSASGIRVITDEIDMATVRLDFPSGAAANLSVSRVSLKPLRKVRVFFDEAHASFDFIENSVKVYRRTAERTISLERDDKRELDPLHEQISDFVDCVRAGRPPVVGGRDGVRALEVARLILARIDQRHRPEKSLPIQTIPVPK